MLHKNTARPREWAFTIWLIASFLLALIFAVLLSAWAVRHALINGPNLSKRQSDIVLSIAKFPGQVKESIIQFWDAARAHPRLLLIDRATAERPNWIHRFPAAEDPGFLLFSGLDRGANQSIVSLIRIADGKELARWNPDWDAIDARITEKPFTSKISRGAFRAIHPILLPEGAIIFNTGSAAVRLNACESKPAWVLDETIHHSNELAPDGTIWSAGVANDTFPSNPWLSRELRDDALVRLTTEGKILEKYSFSKILIAHELGAKLFGHAGLKFNEDPIHINQISIAPRDTAYWKQGDLLISARHLSTVFLYRPATGKLIWYRQGPWMNQHASLFVDDHRIVVFDNNVVGGAPPEQPFVAPNDMNRIFIYDFATDQASQPFESLIKQARPITMTEGRAQVLPDGGVFVEEANFGRHLRFTKDRLLWSRINDYDKNNIGIVSWSRYVTPEDAQSALLAIAKAPKCNAAASAR